MRRAMRHGKKLGMTEPFLHRLVDVVVGEMGTRLPGARGLQRFGRGGVQREEDRFDVVLNDGLPRLEAVLSSAAQPEPER